MKNRVVILGGGIAGMSAAHELIERGFLVTVYEYRSIPGGKARSMPVPNSGTEGRKDLPGEHGFRFFPGFYKHVMDTMKRIPYQGNKRVYDNLVDTTRVQFALQGRTPVTALPRAPRTFRDLKVALQTNYVRDLGLTKQEFDFYWGRVWQLMTSCEERMVNEYEHISWWVFADTDNMSENYKRLINFATRILVALHPEEANTRIIGEIFVQMLMEMLLPTRCCDRVLNGPTNDVWIDPWLHHLRNLGVDYRFGARVERIECTDGEISGVWIEEQGSLQRVEADYYISALPVEVMADLITDEMLAIDPSLAGVQQLKQHVEWMNGIMYYLYEDVEIINGHTSYFDAPWGVTSVSQQQFWPDFDLSTYGDGQVRGIISVDISDWTKPGILYGKPAMECTPEEIKNEIWEQMKRSLNVNGQEILRDDNIHSWFLDPSIVGADKPHPTVNIEPLFVNKVNSWHLRPETYTKIPNLFLASDYVKTNTSLATMEGANEAARRAVNNIIDASGAKVKYCKIWSLRKLTLFAPLRWYDKWRFKRGLAWSGRLPLLYHIGVNLMMLFHSDDQESNNQGLKRFRRLRNSSRSKSNNKAEKINM